MTLKLAQNWCMRGSSRRVIGNSPYQSIPTKCTLNLEASARRAPVGENKYVYIYIKAKQVSGVLGVESSSNNDSPPHRHRLQNEMLQGGFGDFYSIATVACGKEAMASTVATQ